jgi:PAS domain S-box-containing protein
MNKKLRVLIVEDSESDAALNIRALERAGYKTLHERVEDAKQMEAALRKQNWDVVIVDHCLPQMDSFRALELMKEKGLDIPVIVVSGAIGEETAVMIVKAGAKDYVMKHNLVRLAPAVEREIREFEIRCQHKQTEKALRESEDKYRTVLEEIEEGYYELDLAGKWTFFNDTFCNTLGYTREELIGMNYQAVTHKEDVDHLYKRFEEAYRTDKAIKDLSFKAICKDGCIRFIEATAFPIKNEEGNIIGFRGIGRDVTERKKVEDERRDIERKAQLSSRLATVGQMAAGICHEINNPLTTVIGYSDLLTKKDLPEDLKQALGYIREGGRRVADIVRQLLSFARNMQPTRTMVNINDIVSGTLRLREYQLRIANINVLIEFAADLPYTLADPGQLQQVFLNIVLNAEIEMKLAHGQGTLIVKTECINDIIRISFNDDGPGIPEEDLNRIFDPFFTTRKVGEGTGLGLSVCHGIITEHNGRIYVRSKPGKGATFIVELPIVAEPVSAEMPGYAGADIRQVTASPSALLIIDDDPMLLKFLEEFLITRGHNVDAVNNARDAQKAFRSRKYDLILMDILMPDVSGIELYNKFQRLDKSVGSRMLIMTGDTLGKSTRSFLERTGVPYLEKPFDTDALVTKIDEIMCQNG